MALKSLPSVLLLLLSFLGRGDGWGVVDWAVDTWEDTTDAVESGWNSVAGYVSDAAEETTQFFETIANSPYTTEIISSIQRVILVTVDEITDVIEDFNITTWKKLVDDAKYVLVNLPATVQTYIAVGTSKHPAHPTHT